MRLGAALLVSLLAAGPAFADADRELRAAVRAYELGDLHRAVPMLRAATRAPLAARDRAQAWLYLGLTLASLNETEEAHQALSAALRDDPEIDVDRQRVPPAVVAEFDRIRATIVGELGVEAEPDARVFVDGMERGRAPLRIRLRIGSHSLRILSADGARAYEAPGIHVQGEAPAIVRTALQPRVGTLWLEVDPPGAQVIAGNRVLGTTPLGPVPIAFGRHRLVLRKPGFREEGREIVVPPEATLEIRVRLTRDAPPWYRRKRTWGVASLGLSGVATAVALWVGHTARAFEDELRFVERAGALTERRYLELSSNAASRGRAANVLFGAAGAAAVTGIVLLLVDRAPEPSRAWRIVPGPAGAALAVRF